MSISRWVFFLAGLFLFAALLLSAAFKFSPLSSLVGKPDDQSWSTNHLGFCFEDGKLLTNQFGPIRIEIQSAGLLKLTSGRVIACDAFVFHSKSLPRTIPPGLYPVILSVARFTNDQRVACAKLEITTNLVVNWELAGSYGVDSGTGCFMDRDTAKMYEKKLEQHDRFANELITAFGTTNRSLHVNWTIDSRSAANLVAFESGFGDGGYPCFWGLDSEGNIACLITDFGLLAD